MAHTFKVGDKARVKYVRRSFTDAWQPGAIVTIIKIQSGFYASNPDEPYDYKIRTSTGTISYPIHDQLEPLIEKPSTWEKIHEITNWNPTKEKEHGRSSTKDSLSVN
jgi:hypothetical protein